MTERPPLPDHGHRARYNHRDQPCRCDTCRASNAAYLRTYRATQNAHRRARRPVVQLALFSGRL